jgi:hypothetical protein
VRFIEGSRRRALALGALSLVGLFGFLGLQASELVGSTELDATAPSNPPLNVREANVDADGYLRIHEQGVVSVQGTVTVASGPAVQDVRVTNTPLQVTGNVNVGGGTVRKYRQEFYPFTQDEDIEVDISEFTRVRLYVVVNGSDSTVDFVYYTDADVRGSFSVDTGDSRSILLGEVAGTKLKIALRDPDGEQVFVSVFGTK